MYPSGSLLMGYIVNCPVQLGRFREMGKDMYIKTYVHSDYRMFGSWLKTLQFYIKIYHKYYL